MGSLVVLSFTQPEIKSGEGGVIGGVGEVGGVYCSSISFLTLNIIFFCNL